MKLPIARERAPLRSGPVMRISRAYRFEAAHRLPMVPKDHKCHALHGHSYEVEVEVSGQCDGVGWVCDFARMDCAWDALGAHLDHCYLNDLEGLHNPTSEAIAVYLWQRLATYFVDEVSLSRVIVRESGRSAVILEAQP